MEMMFSFQKELTPDDKEQLANHKRGLDAKFLVALPKGKRFSFSFFLFFEFNYNIL
jgi:hypothetical protein